MILSASYKVLLINTKKTSSQLQMVQQSNDWVKYILYSVEYLNSSSQVLEQFSEKKRQAFNQMTNQGYAEQ